MMLKLKKILIFSLNFLLNLNFLGIITNTEEIAIAQTNSLNNGQWQCNALGRSNHLFEDERLNINIAPGTPSFPFWIKIQKPNMEIYWIYQGKLSRYDTLFEEKTLTTFSNLRYSYVTHVASSNSRTRVWIFSSDLSLTETELSTNIFRLDSSSQIKEGLLYHQVTFVRYQCRPVDRIGVVIQK